MWDEYVMCDLVLCLLESNESLGQLLGDVKDAVRSNGDALPKVRGRTGKQCHVRHSSLVTPASSHGHRLLKC